LQDNNQNERVRPRLESASELKGKKAESKGSKNAAKKRLMTIISLVLVLAVTVGAYFVTDAMRPVEETDPSSTGETESSIISLIEGRNKVDMATMTIYHDGAKQYTVTSNLQKKADLQAAAAEGEAVETGLQDFEIEGMPGFTTSYEAINSMVTYSFSVVSTKAVEMGSEDISVYGLDKPAVDVVYTYNDGTEMTMSLGDKVPAGDYYYMNLDHSSDIYMVYHTVYDYFMRPVEQLHAIPEMPAINADILVYLLAEQRGAETVEMVLRDSEEDTTSVAHVHLVQPFDYDVNSDRASQTMISASALKLTAYAGHVDLSAEQTAAEGEEEAAEEETGLALYGLDEPFARVRVSDSNGVTIDMTIGDLVEGDTAYRYATVDESGDIYTVDVSLLGFLSDCRASYLVDQFAGLINIKRINGFTMETPDKTYTAVVTNTPYTNEDGTELMHQEFTFNGEYIEEDLFRDFYTVIIGRMVDKRIENEEEYYLDSEVALRIAYDLDYQDEPYVIEYIEYDRDYYAVRRNGVSVFLIRKDKVNEIVETAELLLAGEYAGIDDTVDYEEIYEDSSYYN